MEDWTGAYDAFSTAMALMPSLSHTRKRAEQARDKMLNIIPPHEKSKDPEVDKIKPKRKILR